MCYRPARSPLAVYGEQAAMGVREAVADINKVGLHGKRIVLITNDDGCDPAKAVAIANTLAVRDRVKLVVGHSCQTASLAASRVYASQKIVQILIAPAGVNAIMPDRSNSFEARKVIGHTEKSQTDIRFMDTPLSRHGRRRLDQFRQIWSMRR